MGHKKMNGRRSSPWTILKSGSWQVTTGQTVEGDLPRESAVFQYCTRVMSSLILIGLTLSRGVRWLNVKGSCDGSACFDEVCSKAADKNLIGNYRNL